MGFFPRSCIYVSRTQSPCSYTLWPLTATVHMSQDPRPQICHESIPGHQTQLAISQRHERPIRRKYLDSVSNEGIGTYLEEMLLHAGLFDDNPHTVRTPGRFRWCLWLSILRTVHACAKATSVD